MPTYVVSAPAGLLTSDQKKTIAREVTRTHNAVTGAQSFFAQVMFVDVDDGNWFVGGAPMADRQVFIQGHIRGGRPAAMKHALVTGLRDALAVAAGLPATRVWSYIVELPPSQMVEYGHVLPEPGGEAAWLAGLPAADRAAMEAVGRSGC